jgi:hypothetical protein
MKRFATQAIAALMAVSAVVPAMTTSAQAHRRGAYIAGGIILGATALAIASSRHAHASEYYVDDDADAWRRRCNYLAHRCDEGSHWACHKYEERGC